MSAKADANTQVIRRIIPGILLIGAAVLGVIFLFALDAGVVGETLAGGLRQAFGLGSAGLYILVAAAGVTLMGGRKGEMFWRLGGLLLVWLGLEGILHFSAATGRPFEEIMALGRAGQGGGLLGAALAGWGLRAVGPLGSYFLFVLLMVVGLFVAGRSATVKAVRSLGQTVIFHWQAVGTARRRRAAAAPPPAAPAQTGAGRKKAPAGEKEPAVDLPPYRVISAAKGEEGGETAGGAAAEDVGDAGTELPFAALPAEPEPAPAGREYLLPPVALLERGPAMAEHDRDSLAENVTMLEETLGSFGIQAKVVCVTQGPALTRYELQPAPGVKISRIVSLADDITMNLSAPSVRIEAPVPGKAVVGIEVPNKETSVVSLRELIEGAAFQQAAGKLPLALGKDITGSHVLGDLAQMPHLLIAGATGSGKSVCINTIIASILYKSRPEEVKLLLIDPKRVEMANYEGIPHLTAPVVIEPDKAASALKWVVREMETRYELFAACGERNIAGYNAAREKEQLEAPPPETVGDGEADGGVDVGVEGALPQAPLPFIVAIIDELADLMMVTPADVEDSICRLAQMGRAAGIHLIVATQRPSVNVITGLIKANIPSRIAFAVSSQVDSRTILDAGGAEKLLGKGDMLYHPMGRPKPLRVQGCFIGDREVNALANYVKSQADPEYREIPDVDVGATRKAEAPDPLFAEAALVFISMNMASVSLLQRKLRVGYSRAARLVDLLEEKRVVGPYDGSKPRAVLMTTGQFEQIYGTRSDIPGKE
ncbi:MAG: DNA translocase FtsK [Gracilibacteraceae bacterium]|nr:DNA translocase FtsK [Gracilibacteraceae bacterium]